MNLTQITRIRALTCRKTQKMNSKLLKATWRAMTALPTDHFPLFLADVHPLASFFILKRLKRLGYSNCRVTTSEKGLVVHAHR
jgi:hypothetical protein